MFKTVHETVAHIKELRILVKNIHGVDIVVAPPFTAVHAAADAARGSNIEVAAQHLHWEREGAFTGEVSAAMIRDAGAEYVIVGHSERRTLFGETDLTVNRRLRAAIGAQLTPIVCIGETLEQREANQTLAVLDQQMRAGSRRPHGRAACRTCVIAYEPVWAIGTGRTCHAGAGAGGARAHPQPHAPVVWRRHGRTVPHPVWRQRQARQHRARWSRRPDVDGALVGGASLDPRAFAEIVRPRVPR